VRWHDAILKYNFRTEKEVGVFALGASESTCLRYTLRSDDPMSYRAAEHLSRNEILRTQTSRQTGRLSEEEYNEALDWIYAEAARKSGAYAGKLRLIYSDVHGREWITTADFSSYVREPNPLPLVHHPWPEALIASVKTEPFGHNMR
jgi:hypothetical protein